MVIWVYTGEVNAKRIREEYLQAVLRQEIAYFDTVSAGEVVNRIQSDTRMSLLSLLSSPLSPSTDLVQQGTSEKVTIIVNFVSSFIAGFTLAYIRCWRLALAMSSILPCIAIIGGVMNGFMSKYMQYVSFPFVTFLSSSILQTLSQACC